MDQIGTVNGCASRSPTQPSDDDAFPSDDGDSDVDQLAEEEVRALVLTFGSEVTFGLNEDHRRAKYRNVSDAQKGESPAKSEAAPYADGAKYM